MIDLKDNGKTIIHAGALPGTPMHCQSVNEFIDQSILEADIYLSTGADAILIENMHDVPYTNGYAPAEIIATMTAIAVELRKLTPKPIGIQILAGANKEALAVAYSASLNFIRAEGFVFGHVADEGYIESCAAELLRYRKYIGAENIAVYTDVKKKHSSHAITSDVSLADTIHAAEFFLSDGIIITGSATGKKADLEEVKTASRSTKLPVIVGSGITVENISSYWEYADAFIVGSHFKKNGDWKQPVDADRVTKFMKEIQILRSQKSNNKE